MIKSPHADVLGGVPGLKKSLNKTCPEGGSNPDGCGPYGILTWPCLNSIRHSHD